MIAVRDLTVAYRDGRIALSEVFFSVKPGERVALIGANGAGKSTLLQALVGLVHGTGEISIDGTPLSSESLRDIRRVAQLAFQNPEDQLFMPTLLEDVAFGPLNYGKKSEEARCLAAHWLEAVGLPGFECRSPEMLSIGERKRAALAAAMACEPRLLLLDEPTAGLDPRSQSILLEILEKLHHAGLTLITATHDLVLLPHLADRAIVLSEEHRIVADGPVDTILSDTDLLLSVNLIHVHSHRHGTLVHRHPHEHIVAHEHRHNGGHLLDTQSE